jgi:tripartite-type tricarboxylate transporter receptor subunit TctC
MIAPMNRLAQQLTRTLLASYLGFALASTGASAQSTFPDRPLRIVIGFAPGGFADITARLFAERLSQTVGQSVVVENVPGAAGAAAAQAARKAKPDGHTLFLMVNGYAAAKAIFKNLAFDPANDFASIGLMAYFDMLVVAKGDGPHKTIADLLTAAKSQPGKINMGSINPGSSQNLALELFKSTTAVNVTVIPYKGTPDLAVAVMGGQLDALVDTYTALKAQIDSGRLRALASTGSRRSAYLPAVPTVRESGFPDYEVVGWNAISAPLGTPPAIVASLNRHLNQIVNAPEFRKRLLDMGAEPAAGTPDEMQRRLTGDIAKWEAIVSKAGLERL